MTPIRRFLIKNTDKFDPGYFSSVNEEIISIKKQIELLPVLFRSEIIVSFLKNHSIRNDWKKANPDLVTLAASGTLFSGSIEALFSSCINNPGYHQDLENYLMGEFAEASPAEKEV